MVHKQDRKNRSKGKTAAELYEAQVYYQRFNEKYTIGKQAIWEENAAELRRQRSTNLKEHIEKGHDGYSVLDWAFSIGSQTNLKNIGFRDTYYQKESSWKLTTSDNKLVPEQVPKDVVPKWYGSTTEAARLIRKVSLRFGADQVGFCRLDRRWVYSHWFDEESKQEYPIKFSDEIGYESHAQPVELADGTWVIPKEMQYVVVALFEMDKDAIDTAPTLTAKAEVERTYSRISFTTVSIADFIRGLGYNAFPSANCTALNIPLAIDGGLGQLGRNAKLINPKLGPRCRISKVITDLPLKVDKPINFGVTEFCDQCKKCASNCPAGAIPFGGRSFDPVNECGTRGILQWQLDHKKCYQYLAKVGTCCICIRACPFNKGKGKVHDIVRWLIRNVKIFNPPLINLDDALGYGKYVSSRNIWRVNT